MLRSALLSMLALSLSDYTRGLQEQADLLTVEQSLLGASNRERSRAARRAKSAKRSCSARERPGRSTTTSRVTCSVRPGWR